MQEADADSVCGCDLVGVCDGRDKRDSAQRVVEVS